MLAAVFGAFPWFGIIGIFPIRYAILIAMAQLPSHRAVGNRSLTRNMRRIVFHRALLFVAVGVTSSVR